MNRKQFLELSVFAVVATGLSTVTACQTPGVSPAVSQPRFLATLFSPQQINEAGKVYLAQTPKENTKQALLQLLSGKNEIATSKDEKAIGEYLNNKVKEDFAEGNTVNLKGWILSRTEARQCALYSLVNR